MTSNQSSNQKSGPAPLRAIEAFEQDDELHWVAQLECGHTQHVRHEPPLVERPWVLTESGRESRLGERLACVKCLEERTEPS